MQINVDSRKIGAALKACLIADRNPIAKILTLEDAVKLIGVASHAYVETIVPAEVITPGVSVLDLGVYPYLMSTDSIINLSITDNDIEITAETFTVSAPINSTDPELITEKRIPEYEELDIENISRLNDIVYAIGNSTLARDVIWIYKNILVCGDGPRLAIHILPEETDKEFILRSSSASILDQSGLLFDDKGAWLFKDETAIYLPRVEGNIPGQIYKLTEINLLDTDHLYLVNKEEVQSSFGLARTASKEITNKLGVCTLEMNDYNAEIIVKGPHPGTFKFNTETHGNAFSLRIKPGYVLDALRNCINDKIYLGILNIFGMNIFAISDREVLHLISPVGE